ncbi:hypothetical protein [Nocardia seriolae]|uniref:Non-specific serine/threonine protein kinase n=2 Tax=Nocardia seriolae TaxID=37332 RepID=A0A0B8NBC1_9NOCA|nr:hypothetical protein [Nocardia seriolae]APB01346.1 Non-specific serine/threonine protein kinase [Nocardia seriolae]MTJ61157.1 hypothetical protein [Nocardia seriolae]MTJ74394.1 hypothetical protein [Nocardia seriolae]MTJ90717.1 hypothetical protein [Nocardia seriolae]MTK39136.1 hypothetical protein [Nocardia seriolae]
MASGKDESADRPESEAASGAPEAGRPESGFGPSLNDFGPSLNDFGPSVNTFGPTPAVNGPGWSPAPGPQSPELAWRPADASIPPPPPQYRAPDSWGPTTGQYPAQYPGGNGTAPQGNGMAAQGNGMATGQFPAVEGTGQVPDTSGVEQTVKIPPGGVQSPSVDPERTTRIADADPAAAERNSGSGAAAASNGAEEATSTASPDSWWRSAPSGFPPVPPSAEPAAAQGESLSWADDPIVKALTPKTPVPQAEPERTLPWRKIGAFAGGGVVLLAVIGLVVVAVMRGGKDDAPTAGATATGKASNTAAALSCPARHEGNLTIGNGAGSTGSGVDAILGFQHAFYADRSGSKARTFVAPDSPTVSPADVIQQKGIDPLKPGTSYCLQIVGPTAVPAPVPAPGAPPAPGVFETYDVDITEHHADGTTQVYAQRVLAVERDGKHLIYSIEERS